MLIPLFDIEKDLGAYGYYGYNKTKVNMIMNPFFNKKLLEDGNDNNLKNKFINDVVNIIKN